MTIHAILSALTLITTTIVAQHEWRQVQLPEACLAATITADPATGALVLFGGLGDTALGDTWLRSGTNWVRSQVTGGPGPRYYHRVAADLARNQLVMFGGWSGGAYGDTWVRGAQGWWRLYPAQNPAARYAHGFAWDTLRGRGVLYGGYNNGHYADTWEWTGSDWIQRVQSSLPGGRSSHAMVYDPDSRATLVFGGHNGGPLQDTWLWDGQAWTQPSPPTRPSARWDHAMAQDPIRHVVVLFGGYSGTAGLGDTWEWSGITRTWTQRATTGPSARLNAAMTFDPRRGRVVLFGGEEYPTPSEKFSDLWEWDGSVWTRVEGSSPSPRYGSRMAYDPQADTTILFGGIDNRGNARMRDDTWLWNGTAWLRANPSVNPPARGYASLVHDPLRQETVLFGGRRSGTNLGDTWVWRAGAWTQRMPANAPTARHGHASTFHAGSGEVMTFGGHDGGGRNDLWSWDGINWRDRMPTGSLPGARWHAAMGYDPILQRLVLFGGYNGAHYGDTWAWDATVNTWTQLTPTVSPGARSFSELVYDRTRKALVLFGGVNASTVFSDTWELRGSTWTKCTQLTEPTARGYQAMAYDTRRERLWAFGGYPVSGGDTWECFNPNPGSFTLVGPPGCPIGALGVPALQADGDSLPYRGENFNVALSGLPTGFVSAILLVGVPPPVAIPLSFLGFPQCSLYVFPSFLDIPMAGGGPGRAIATLPIPHFSSWVGSSLLLQGAALVTFPQVQLGMSQAGVAVVGARHQ